MRAIAKALFAFVLVSGWAAHAQDVNSAFEKLKTLEGQWELSSGDGHSTVISYKVGSAGSTLVEEHMGMTSVYHKDGNSLLMTHYCSVGNQPRVRATNFQDANVLDFSFVDVSNLEEGKGYISHLTITWISNDEVREDWSYTDKDGQVGTESFSLKRVVR